MKVQEALKAAIDYFRHDNFPIGADREYRKNRLAVYELCKSALAEIGKCEPVAEAIRERDRLGFAVVNVIGKLDEIIENTQEVEVDDFLHIAVPVDMWNELQAELEYMPKRADLFTSPQPRDWVGLTDAEALKLWDELHPDSEQRSKKDYWLAIEAKLKQLNTKG